QPRVPPGVDEHHPRHRRERDDRTDREVDPAHEDHERQPHRDEDQVRVVDEQVRHRVVLENAPVSDLAVPEHADEEHQGGHRRERPAVHLPGAAGQIAEPAGGRPGRGRDVHAGTPSFGTGSVPACLGGGTPLARRRVTKVRTRFDCSRQMTMITAALNAGVAEEEIPRNTTVLSRVAMSIAPTDAPPRENFPPASAVPPMTTARMASSSIWYPVRETSTVMALDTANTPAIPARTPLIA